MWRALLKEDLHNKNCIDFLVLADLYQAPMLKGTALKYLANNIGDMNAREWKETLIAYLALLFEVMEMMIKQFQCQKEKRR